MKPRKKNVYRDYADINAMLDDVRARALETPRPVHIDLYPGPDPDGKRGTFVVATAVFGDDLCVIWQNVGKKRSDRQLALFEWTAAAHLRGLILRSGMAHAYAWPWPDEWEIHPVPESVAKTLDKPF